MGANRCRVVLNHRLRCDAMKDYLEEGDNCQFEDCDGKMGYEPVVNCSCHINPPCGACVDNPLVCLTCGWEDET